MREIFSTLTIHSKEKYDTEVELLLQDHFDGSDTLRDFVDLLYSPEKDESMLDYACHTEFEAKGTTAVAPSGTLEKLGVIYATGVRYSPQKGEPPSEKASYAQAKGNFLEWSLFFESVNKLVRCTLEFYIFYRDQYGDICKLHADNNKLDIEIPPTEAKGNYIRIKITRGEKGVMDTGRYYFVFNLIPQNGIVEEKPVALYINIVPAKTKIVNATGDMIGMQDIYQQMDSLAQQKMFNDQRQMIGLLPVPINLHAAVMGGKGSGKTSFAHVLHDFYIENGLLENTQLDIVDVAQWSTIRDDSTLLTDSLSSAEGGMLYLENAGSLIATDARGNKNLMVKTLVSQLRDDSKNTTIVLADTPERITQLLTIEDLKSYIGQVYKLPSLNIDQMMAIAHREFNARHFILTDETENAMKSYLSAIPDASTTDVSRLIDTMITRMSGRVIEDSSKLFLTENQLTSLQPEDVPLPQIGRYQDALDKLNKLVGLKSLKYNIETHLNLVRFAHLRQQNGLQAVIPPLHMIFTGNPGTGKTTVASLLGEIYASIGILKTGHVVKADRKKLVGQYIGDTEENTKRALEQAHGNILFIDEAYTLVGDPDDKRDFGPKALDCLLDELGKENTDMIIILAGYPDEMEQLLKSNKGLQSRFPYTFHFEDYTESELMEIAIKTAEGNGYRFSEEALERLRELVHREVTKQIKKEDKHFGNARYITRLISTRIIPNMSRRVLSSFGTTTEPMILSRIEAEDIPMKSAETDFMIDEALISRTLNELDALTGRDEVKRTLRDIVSLARTRQQAGDELASTIPLHWTFTGATGTGKSSVARLLAQLLHAFHLISSDRMVQLRMPQTAHSTWSSYEIDRLLRDTMKQAGQGLLFIDMDDIAGTHIDVQWLRCKLTSLTAELPGSYAFVIAVDDTHLPEQPIDMPLSTSVLHFDNYTVDELMKILVQRLTNNGFTLSMEASQIIYERILALYTSRTNLSNARTIKHICTALAAEAQLRSIESQKAADSSNRNEPIEISKEDVDSIKWNKINNSKIGF